MTHNHKLENAINDKFHFHLDRFSMGLGGYDSWSPNVLEEFLIDYYKKPNTPISFTFIMKTNSSFNEQNNEEDYLNVYHELLNSE